MRSHCWKRFTPSSPNFMRLFFCFLNCFLPVEVSFAEEFISVANHLLLHGFRQEILMWQGQVLCYDLCLCDACTGMALTYAGMSLISFLAQDFCSQSSMADVGLRAETLYAWGIGHEDAEVVEHSCFFDKLGIELQFGMIRNNL